MVILVVGPESRARRVTTSALRHGDFPVRAIGKAEQAGGAMRRNRPLAVVLIEADATATGAVANLRPRTDAPIIVVSEFDDAAARVANLDAGADDCLVHPFDVEEFLARLRARIRRTEPAAVADAPLVFDDLTIHLGDRRLLRADGTEAPLSPTEWKLVDVLVRRPGHLVTQDEILRSVWGAGATTKLGLLRVHIASIRRKVEPDPARPRYFVTAPGLGFRFAPAALEARGSAS